jgi:quinol monooxygenase YgiN
LECIKANQRGTLTTEPLAVTYLFGEDETAPNTFRFFEAYKGRAGFEAHTKTPHFADWETFVATDPLSAPPQVQFYSEFPAGAPRLPELTAEHYCLGVCLRVKPERRDEFLESIKANQRGTLTTEPLVVTYLVGEDETAPNTFHLFEAYKGRAGFEAHTKSPHFAVWEKFVATEPFSAPPQVLLYVRVYMRACVCLPACLPTYLPACLSVSLFLSFSLFVCMCMCVFVRARPRMCLGNV